MGLLQSFFESDFWQRHIYNNFIAENRWTYLTNGLKNTVIITLAALVIGAGDARILFRHLVVNAVGPIIVQVTFLVPNAIFTEAFLSFIGIGISAPMASWGSMAQDARQVFSMYPVQLLLPTLCICITIFALNFLGEGIGDAFNPKKSRG